MIYKLSSLLSLALLFLACTPEGRIFSENQELSPELEWLKEDARTFKVTIDDASLAYDITLAFRYASGFQYNDAKVLVTETSPSGAEIQKEYSLHVRDENGEYIGEPAMDIWDSEHLVESKKTYSETGTYSYKIEHAMVNDPMNFAMEIGMIVDKSK